MVQVQRRPARACSTALPGELRVWASHGDFVAAAPPGFRVVATSANAPVAAMEDTARAPVRAAVPSRGRAHRARARDPPALRVRRLRLHRRLDDGVVHRRGDRAHPAAGRRRAGRLRAQRRRRFDRRGAADPPRDRRPPHVHLRRQRRCCGWTKRRRSRRASAARCSCRSSSSTRPTCSSTRLAGVIDPERKRKIIGQTFIEVFERRRAALGGFDFLAQGTLYPDVIESVSVVGPSAAIKSHHNVGGLPEHMRFTLVEPLRELFKDEVRGSDATSASTRSSSSGSRSRARASPSASSATITRAAARAAAQGRRHRRRRSQEARVSTRRSGKASRCCCPCRASASWATRGPTSHTIAVRAVESRDGMTADWARLPHELLGAHLVAHRQRGARRQPRRLRHLVEAAVDDRVGVGAGFRSWSC